MNKYLVRVTETYQKFVHVEANDVEEVYEEAQRRWNNSDPQFVLTSDNFVDADFYVYDADMR